jgi:hypothetical protein
MKILLNFLRNFWFFDGTSNTFTQKPNPLEIMKIRFRKDTRKNINSTLNAFNHTLKWLKTRKKENLNAF